MNTYTPNTSELYASHIPALAMLVRLGWEYRSPLEVLKLRDNSTREVLLRPVLIEFLRQHRFEYKSKTYPLSNEGIQQILTTLASPGLAEGLMPANEAVHDCLPWASPSMSSCRTASVTLPPYH
jgi:type I restriction enzyme R subunit